MNTAFMGSFDNFEMTSAKEVEVLEAGCDSHGMVVVTKFSEPEKDGPTFYYERPTNTSFGAGPPNVRDPFERKWLRLDTSMEPNSGEGKVLLQPYIGFLHSHIYTNLLF